MNPTAQTAYAALDRSMDANAAGEIKGLGPAWSCERYAEHGHNYHTCPDCFGNFNRHMDAKEAE